jgi:hypothetical protein
VCLFSLVQSYRHFLWKSSLNCSPIYQIYSSYIKFNTLELCIYFFLV